MNKPQDQTPVERPPERPDRETVERALDQALEQSFPASDTPAMLRTHPKSPAGVPPPRGPPTGGPSAGAPLRAHGRRPHGSAAATRKAPTQFAQLDWEVAVLQSPTGWPDVLKTVAEVVLAAPTPMAVIGPSGVALCNEGCRRLFGPGRTDHPDANLAQRWPEMAQLQADALAAARLGQSLSVRGRCFLGDGAGETLWVDLDFSPIGGRGEAGGVLLVAVDRTPRQHAEQELARLNESLDARIAERQAAEEALRQSQKMEAVGQLTGGIAHDFNNLLTGIIGSLDLLQRRLAQGRLEDLSRYTTAAMTSANRAAGLTHRLLAFARRRPLDAKVVDVNRLVAAIEDLLRRTLSEKIELSLDMPASVWRVKCDPNQLENAILNLAINARDAMPDGGRLEIATANVVLDEDRGAGCDLPAGEYVRLSVNDTGVGMTPEVIAHVFEPFFTTKPLGLGTGLGLPTIYSFVQQSGGGVRIESQVGQGASVSLLLPRCVEDVGPAEDGPGSPGPPEGDGQVVLVVEDEQTVRALVMDVLQERGYRALSATDGMAALEVLQSEAHVDLLVTDVGLPGLDGPQLVAAALQHRPDLKVLFMTAYAREAPAGPATLQRPIAVLQKPFTVDGLLAHVRAALEASA
jgi:signal transduction histidine kinase